MKWVLYFRRRHRATYVAWALLIVGIEQLALSSGPWDVALVFADAALMTYLIETRTPHRALCALTSTLKNAELLFFGTEPVSFRLELKEAAPYLPGSVLDRQVAVFIENVVGFSKRPLRSQVTSQFIQITAGPPANR